MTETNDKTDAMPMDVDLEAPFAGDEVTPLPVSTPATCWYCPGTAGWVNAADPAPRCERDSRDHYDTCSIANDRSWAICAAKFMLRFGRFEYYFGPERRTARALRPLGQAERRSASPPPFPPRRDDE